MSIFDSSIVNPNDTALADQYNELREDTLLSAGDFAVTTGSANAYILALDSEITAYVTGMVVKFQANFTNTAPATIDVNGLGAKTIKKNVNKDLFYGDILEDGVYIAIYDGTNFQIQKERLYKTAVYTSDDAIDAGDAVWLSDGTTTTATITQTAFNTTSSTTNPSNRVAQTFLTNAEATILDSITIRVNGVSGTSSEPLILDIYAVDGSNKPTGAALYSSTVDTIGSIGPPTTLFKSIGLAISANTTYAFVLRGDGSGSFNVSVSRNSTDVYADGVAWTSTDGGSTWSSVAGDFYFVAVQTIVDIPVGQIARTNASTAGQNVSNFIGFAVENIPDGSQGAVAIDGFFDGLSGLTINSDYFLTNTLGEISTVAGSQVLKVGKTYSNTSEIKIIVAD